MKRVSEQNFDTVRHHGGAHHHHGGHHAHVGAALPTVEVFSSEPPG